MKFLVLMIILITVSSCTHQLVINDTSDTPDWVHFLRSGEQSLKIVTNNKVLYRANLTDNKLSADILCDKTLEKNFDYLNKEYPFLKNIPITVEYVFYDKQVQDCSTTISLPREFVSKINKLKELRNKFQKENEHIKNELKAAKNKNNSLKNKINNLNKYINENKHLFAQGNAIQSRIDQIHYRVKNEAQRAIASAFTGATQTEIQKAIQRSFTTTSNFHTKCYDVFKSHKVSYHGKILMCWDDNNLLGYCDNKEEKCWTKSI